MYWFMSWSNKSLNLNPVYTTMCLYWRKLMDNATYCRFKIFGNYVDTEVCLPCKKYLIQDTKFVMNVFVLALPKDWAFLICSKHDTCTQGEYSGPNLAEVFWCPPSGYDWGSPLLCQHCQGWTVHTALMMENLTIMEENHGGWINMKNTTGTRTSRPRRRCQWRSLWSWPSRELSPTGTMSSYLRSRWQPILPKR